MPLVPLFTIAKLNGSTIRLTDTSTGDDPTITKRRVFLQKSDGSYLVSEGTQTDYIEWDIAEVTITLDVFSQDTAVNIKVQWLNAGNEIVNQKIELYGFDFNTKAFIYNLTALQEANPSITSNLQYYANKAKLWVEVKSASNAIDYGSDITKAQNCYNRATYLINHQNLFF